jgi:ferredoxin
VIRKLRISLAALCFAAFCLLFVDVSGFWPQKLAFLAKIQLVPALIAGSLLIVLALALLTLLLGRVYCSILCPLGILQDLIARLGKKGRYSFSPARGQLRVGAMVLFVLAFCLGIPWLFALLDPYSSFGRIATDLFAPLWQAGSNLLNLASESAGSYAVGPTPIWQKGVSALAAAVLTLALIAYLAFKGGRTWCNTICPVGTMLGYLNRFALIRPRLEAAKCIHCGLCVRECKASCIDSKKSEIDAGRCVVCFNCLDKCRRGAIDYGPRSFAPKAAQAAIPERTAQAAALVNKTGAAGGPNLARRGLLVAAFGLAASPAHAVKEINENEIAALIRKERPPRNTPITPPGSRGLASFREKCSGCQLCVSACPNQVLSSFDQGEGLLQPTLSFERGFCRVNCVTCSAVCPTGAILPISAAKKSATQIGRAVLDPSLCINSKGEGRCFACGRNCPPGAINLLEKADGSRTVAVDAERCTGCGACEYYCPVRPLAAIAVQGNEEHRPI